MENKYTIDIERKVWDEEDGVSILVRPCESFPEGYVNITSTHCSHSEDFYGSFSITIPRGMAEALGMALIAQAKWEEE